MSYYCYSAGALIGVVWCSSGIKGALLIAKRIWPLADVDAVEGRSE